MARAEEEATASASRSVEDDESKYRLCLCYVLDKGVNYHCSWFLVDLPRGEKVEETIQVDKTKVFEGPNDCPKFFSIAALGSTLYVVGGSSPSPSSSVFSYNLVVDGHQKPCGSWFREADLKLPRNRPCLIASPPSFRDKNRELHCFGSISSSFNPYVPIGEKFTPPKSRDNSPGEWRSLPDNPSWLGGSIYSGGFVTIDGQMNIMVISTRRTATFNLNTQKWVVSPVEPHCFGLQQAPVIDDVWYVCERRHGRVLAMQMKPFPSTSTIHQVEVEGLPHLDKRSRRFFHHLLQIGTKTLCRVSSITVDFCSTVKCSTFQVDKGTPWRASKVSTANFVIPVLPRQHLFDCVILEQNRLPRKRMSEEVE